MPKLFTPLFNKNRIALLPIVKAVKTFFLLLLFCCFGYSGYSTTWTTVTAGDITILSNWSDGSIAPTTFTTPGDKWIITLAMTIPSSFPGPTIWTVGTASAAPDTVIFAAGDTVTMSGAGSDYVINIYGDVRMTGGLLTLGGAGTTATTNVYGNTDISAGTLLGSINTNGAGSHLFFNANGNYDMTAGSVVSGGASGVVVTKVHGNFSMSAGAFNANGASSIDSLNIFGNGSFSGTAAMTNTGASCISSVHFSLPASTGTMMIDNTSTATWSGTQAVVDALCTAQLDGNFSTNMGAPGFPSITYGLTVLGTLICPATNTVNGSNFFTLNAGATLKVAATTGINGAITTTGTRTFSPGANYVFNGSAAQVTGSYLPSALVAPDTITVANSAGVTLSQMTGTAGTLLFTSGVLNTGAFSMSVLGTASAVVGAGASSYVNGTLLKTIAGSTTINYEVGNVDYAPMLLTLSSAGTSGSLGVKCSGGLHPSVATSGLSTANMANHYWTISNLTATGPTSATLKATYNASDIIGGSNTSFQTQKYDGSVWLGAPLTTANTVSPYTSNPVAAIADASLAGDYIFGNIFCGTLPITGTATACAGSTTILSDATTGGTWNSTTTSVATVNASGTVGGVSGGTAVISYTKAGCTVTTVVTINALPIVSPITVPHNDTIVCVTRTDTLSDATPGGTWVSKNTSLATVNSSGIVFGVAPGIDTILYIVSNACGSDTVKKRIRVQTLAACMAGIDLFAANTVAELKISPNPNAGIFALTLASINDEEVHVIVMNITGEKVKEATTRTNKQTDVQLDHVAGVYLISATADGERYFAKVVIQ